MSETTTDRFLRAQERDFIGLESSHGVADASTASEFQFVQLADTQFGFMNHDKSWLEDIALAERAVHHINRLAPAFAVVCGDLTNSLVDLTPDADPAVRDRQVADFKRVFAQIRPDVPLVCVCGNHDVGNRPTDRSIARYAADFGDDYFAFAHRGVFCIAANSNLFNLDPDDAPLAARQLVWLEQQLARAAAMPARHIILFCHHPLFFRHVDEPDESDEFGVTHFVENGVTHTLQNSYFHIPLKHRRRVVDLLSRFGCRLVFTGHWHRNAVARCPTSGVTVVTTTAVGKQLADDQPGMRLVSVTNDDIQYPFFTLDQLDQQERQ
jgi:3',5'-cyclic AMP phosphodiesterase CpdA